jgi:alkylresorcinol/alkylpyrone synthase
VQGVSVALARRRAGSVDPFEGAGVTDPRTEVRDETMGRFVPRTAKASAGAAIVASKTALPSHRYLQDDLAEAARRLFPSRGLRPATLARFFDRVGVRERYLALPAERYAELDGFGGRSRAWLEVATELGEAALRAVLEESGLDPRELGQLVTTTVTGVAVPSLDARLMNRIAFAPGLRRMPLFGLGCAGGAAGLARVDDYLRAYPRSVAALLSVELCSLTLQPGDVSVANVLSSGLFGDGAAALIAVGAEHPLAARAAPKVLASRSCFFAGTERVMGWDMVDGGFRVVLSPEVPAIARERIPGLLRAFLGEHGLGVDDVKAWVTHPGGPKVMDAMEEGLALPRGTLDASRESLARMGNLSSASVLSLLDEFRRKRRPAEGAYGVLMAMGPAFAAELSLLRW